MSLLRLFCNVDDFYNEFEQYLEKHKIGRAKGNRGLKPVLSISEIMTIIIHFHQSSYRDFKAYYTKRVKVHLKSEFPNLVSYNRFIEKISDALMPLCLFRSIHLAQVTGIPSAV
jgi:hypothetical protein